MEYINKDFAKLIALEIQGDYILNQKECLKSCSVNLEICYDHCMILIYTTYFIFLFKMVLLFKLGKEIFIGNLFWMFIYCFILYVI
jgi:hypothetical protein